MSEKDFFNYFLKFLIKRFGMFRIFLKKCYLSVICKLIHSNISNSQKNSAPIAEWLSCWNTRRTIFVQSSVLVSKCRLYGPTTYSNPVCHFRSICFQTFRVSWTCENFIKFQKLLCERLFNMASSFHSVLIKPLEWHFFNYAI